MRLSLLPGLRKIEKARVHCIQDEAVCRLRLPRPKMKNRIHEAPYFAEPDLGGSLYLEGAEKVGVCVCAWRFRVTGTYNTSFLLYQKAQVPEVR